jgi:predicted glycosyltransferase
MSPRRAKPLKRLFMYSQDGMGLGHLRRSTNIAREVLRRSPDCNVLIVADSPATSLFSYQRGIDYLKLPTVVKTGATSWAAGSLSLHVQQLIELRSQAILQAFRGFEPDAVLVDHMPVGALGELKPMLECATRQIRRPRLLLGLRDVLDDPATIHRVWSELGAYEHLSSYDAVLVYGSRQIYDASAAYRLLPTARSVIYCGYVSPGPSRDGFERCPDDEGFLLMMGGGGRDAFPLASGFVEAFPTVFGELGLPGVLLTGPSMSDADRRALQARAPSCMRIESGFGHATAWVQKASAVVTMAGYNSLCEVLKWRKKALVVPRSGPSAEQSIRTRLFSERSLIRTFGPGPPVPQELARALTALMAQDGIPDSVNIPPLNGAERAAAMLLDWHGNGGVGARTSNGRAPVTVRAPAPRRTPIRRGGETLRHQRVSRSQALATPDLPLLAAVLDPDEMAPRLGELLASGGRNGRRARVASVELVAYRKARRALIAYEVELPFDGGRVYVLGKHFGDSAQARRVRETSLALHRTHTDGRFAVPQPLDWVPELSLVLYRPATGRSFRDAIRARDADRFLRLAAESIAGLQASRLTLDRRFDLAKELRNLTSWAELVGAAHPDQESAALEVLARLSECGPEIGFELDVPIHKDLHYEHLVLGSRLSVLDVDEMRFGDPSFDLAHFCTYLNLLVARAGGSRGLAEAAERVFLEEYARHTGWRSDERFTYFCAYTCLKIAKQLCRIEGVAPRPTGHHQRDQVSTILEHGRSLVRTLR